MSLSIERRGMGGEDRRKTSTEHVKQTEKRNWGWRKDCEWWDKEEEAKQ